MATHYCIIKNIIIFKGDEKTIHEGLLGKENCTVKYFHVKEINDNLVI